MRIGLFFKYDREVVNGSENQEIPDLWGRVDRYGGHGFAQGMASHTFRISFYVSFIIYLSIVMFHKRFKDNE